MMALQSVSTAGATAAILAALGSVAAPETTSPPLGSTGVRQAYRAATSLPNMAYQRTSESSVSNIEPAFGANEKYCHNAAARKTSPIEKLVGEMRRLSLLGSDWDGEGACSPILSSARQAESFVRMLNDLTPIPEPMLHANGRSGLYWNDGNLYADLEFLEDGRLAYFVDRSGDKHKGVIKFDASEMPSVLSTLLQV